MAPSKRRQFTARHCYRFSLFFILFLVAAALLGALYDIIQQMVHDKSRTTRPADISIAASTYLAVGFLAAFISLSRWLTTRRAVFSIPKPYIPIEKGDLPKRVHDMVSAEYSRCALALHVSQPKGRTLAGWGSAGTPYEGMNFRQAILESVDTLKSMFGPLVTDEKQDRLRRAYSPRSSLLTPYLPALFDPPDPVLLPQHRALIQLWDSHIERARWSKDEPTQADFEEVLRIVAIILAEFSRKGKLPAGLVEENQSGTTLASK